MIATEVNLRRLCSIFTLVITFAAFFIGVANVRSVRADVLAITRYVASSGNDTGDCSSAASPCRTIQYAVNEVHKTEQAAQ